MRQKKLLVETQIRRGQMTKILKKSKSLRIIGLIRIKHNCYGSSIEFGVVCRRLSLGDRHSAIDPIGLYREYAIAIQDEVGDSNGGNVFYVTMRITFNIPEFTRSERH